MSYSRDQLDALISAYLDDELSVEERTAVEDLLANDRDARNLLAELQAIRGVLHSLPRAKASGDMVGAIRARMEREALLGAAPLARPGGRTQLSWASRWVAAAAIVFMASAGGYVIWNLNRPDARSEDQPLLSVAQRESSPGENDKAFATDIDGDGLAETSSGEPMSLADAADSRASAGTEALVLSPASPPPAPSITDRSAVSAEKGEPVDSKEASQVVAGTPTDKDHGIEPPQTNELLFAAPFGKPTDGRERVETATAAKPPTDEPPSEARAGAVVLTLAWNDASSRQRAVDELQDSAPSVRTLPFNDRMEITSLARQARAAEPQLRFVPQQQDVPASVSPEGSSAEKGRARYTLNVGDSREEEGVQTGGISQDLSLGEEPVADLLVVVPDEPTRQQVMAQFGVEPAGEVAGEAVDAARGGMFGGYGAAVQPHRMFWSLHADPPASGPALPDDSIVFRRGRLAGQTDLSAASRPAALTERTVSYGYQVESAEGEGRKLGAPASRKAFPESEALVKKSLFATTQTAAASISTGESRDRYVLRLHIRLAEPAPAQTQPTEQDFFAGRSGQPTSAPAAGIQYDPSVLDLQLRPAQAPAGSQPSGD